MKKIAVFGTGTVGQTIALKLISLGYGVMIGTRSVEETLSRTSKDVYGNPSFKEWHAANGKVEVGTFSEAAQFGELLFNTTKGTATLEVLKSAGEKNLDNKILIDVANPLDFSKGMPPALVPELSNTNSLGEEIQKTFPNLNVVKTLNTMWCGLMVNPAMIGGGDHINYICGNDVESKSKVISLLKEFGWKDENILDIGDISSARGTEAVLPVWLRVFGTLQTGAFNFKLVK